MKPTWGKPRWCYSCNHWQIAIILVLFLSLTTYGIFKLTQDPYRTIMGELCDLPQPEYLSTGSRPRMEVWYSSGAGTWDSTHYTIMDWSIIPDSMDIDSVELGIILEEQ